VTAAPDTSATMQHVVDIAGAPARSFGLSDELPALEGEPHAHLRHQLLYASAGALELVTADGRWWLPPERAAWIRGGTVHRVVVRRLASLRTVYLDPALLTGPAAEVRVFQVGALARLMLQEAMRWGPDHPSTDRLAGRFFPALAALAEEWMGHAVDLRLPRAQSPELQRALDLTVAHLSDPRLNAVDVARQAGLSSRTLARRCRSELGIPWRQVVQRARLLHAMDRLTDPDTSVTEVCYAVGYQSLGTFSSAFRALVGESPRQFQARLEPGSTSAPAVATP
jgi:AraC-like DNA-binding protein